MEHWAGNAEMRMQKHGSADVLKTSYLHHHGRNFILVSLVVLAARTCSAIVFCFSSRSPWFLCSPIVLIHGQEFILCLPSDGSNSTATVASGHCFNSSHNDSNDNIIHSDGYDVTIGNK